MNAATTPGLAQPASTVVSGAPGIGRDLAEPGPRRPRLHGERAGDRTDRRSSRDARPKHRSRVFVGVDSSPDDTERARLALQDLRPFGAWDRAVLAVGTSTGTGTVDQGQVTPLEYMYDGDVATVSTQYSVLPSFLSFLVDGGNAQDAGRSLFDAVYARWQQLPPDDRPALVVFGESLGAYGGDAAFPDQQDLAARTRGALFVGPPNGTALWQQLTDEREPGTPERLPQYRRRQGGPLGRSASRPECSRRCLGTLAGGVSAERLGSGGVVVPAGRLVAARLAGRTEGARCAARPDVVAAVLVRRADRRHDQQPGRPAGPRPRVRRPSRPRPGPGSSRPRAGPQPTPSGWWPCPDPRDRAAVSG